MSAGRLQLVLALALAAAACAKDSGQAGEASTSGQAAANPLIAMQPEAARSDARAQLFLAKGCPQCHAISKLQVTSPTNVGPDLSVAFTDVRSRFNTSLDSFLTNPTGTMQIVFSGQIQLTAAEKDSVFRLLRDLSTNP